MRKRITTKLVQEPRYIGINIERDTYDALANAAYKAGDKLSKLVRDILDEAVLKIK
jgi:hypothetical protein